MYRENVKSSILLGDDWDYIIFKSALTLAEGERTVWLISHEPFTSIPKDITPPDNDILKRITFIYLKDNQDLIKHFNTTHMWHKIPDVVIIKGLGSYCNLEKSREIYNCVKTASTMASLLDGIGFYGDRLNKAVHLLVTCANLSAEYTPRLKVLVDMYFTNIINQKADSDKEELVKKICEHCLN